MTKKLAKLTEQIAAPEIVELTDAENAAAGGASGPKELPSYQATFS